MIKFSSKLRIGERLGLGFGLVGVLFIGVVWHYHHTLRSVLDDYRQLHAVFEVRKSLALEIEIEMAAAREAEKDFLIDHQERFVGSEPCFDQHRDLLTEMIFQLCHINRMDCLPSVEVAPPLADLFLERYFLA